MEEVHVITLDIYKLPLDHNYGCALKVAETLLKESGLVKVQPNPAKAHPNYLVKSIPRDVPLAGVYWIRETSPRKR